MGARRLEQRCFKPPHVARIETEFRELKLKHAQRMCDARSTCDRGDVHAILGHDRCQNAMANTKVFDQRRFCSQAFTKAIQGYWLGCLDADQFCFRSIDLAHSLEKLRFRLPSESPKHKEPFTRRRDLA